MEVGASQLPTAKPSRGTLGASPFPLGLHLRGYHPLRRVIPDHFGFSEEGAAGPLNPTSLLGFPSRFGLGFPPFGRPYSGDPMLVSFPPPTKMFPFGGFPLGTRLKRLSRAPWIIHPWQEVPFGDPRIYGCMRLPGAYRRLPRPSSAP